MAFPRTTPRQRTTQLETGGQTRHALTIPAPAEPEGGAQETRPRILPRAHPTPASAHEGRERSSQGGQTAQSPRISQQRVSLGETRPPPEQRHMTAGIRLSILAISLTLGACTAQNASIERWQHPFATWVDTTRVEQEDAEAQYSRGRTTATGRAYPRATPRPRSGTGKPPNRDTPPRNTCWESCTTSVIILTKTDGFFGEMANLG